MALRVARRGRTFFDKAVTFLVEREQELHVWKEQNLPKALPRLSGGQLPGRNKVEEGREEEEEEAEGQKVEIELINEIPARDPRETDAAEGGVSLKIV